KDLPATPTHRTKIRFVRRAVWPPSGSSDLLIGCCRFFVTVCSGDCGSPPSPTPGGDVFAQIAGGGSGKTTGQIFPLQCVARILAPAGDGAYGNPQVRCNVSVFELCVSR